MAVATHRAAEQVTELDDVEQPTSSERPRWVVPTAVALVLALVGALVVAAFYGSTVIGGFAESLGRSNALEAGREVGVRLTTFDGTTAEEDARLLTEVTTPMFNQAFEGDRAAFVRSLREGKVKMTGVVTEAGVTSYDGNAARVLVAVQATVAGGPARDYRLDLTMVHQDGDWLADKVEFLS